MAKGKRAQQAGAENANDPAASRNGDARTIQDAAAKDSARDATFSPEQPAASSKGAIDNTIGSAAGGSNSSAVARKSLPSAKNPKTKSVKATSARPDLVRPASEPQPTRDGQSTLTRTLGLKVGRIVIDAGHGGPDTVTIGPTRLSETDLSLGGALRVGAI